MRESVRLGFAAGLGVAVLFAAGFARAAAQDAPPADAEARFEVASIRGADISARLAGAGGGPVPPIGVRTLPNGMNATLATVRMLLMSAYQLRDYQVIGGPGWMNSDRFDISARAAGEVPPAVARQMLKNLLNDRFKLKARTETREADVYALVLAHPDGRLGPGLKRTSAECEVTLEARKKGVAAPPSGPPDLQAIRKQTFCGMSIMGSSASGASNYSMGAVTLDRLVNQIAGEVRGPVVDRTGLTGLFDILLEYMSQSRQLQAAPTVTAPDLTKDAAPPAMRDALREQLGLRLETEKGSLEVLVIDSLERPSEN
jgi:uncharacterized protein (TIGR03435 family)